MPIKAGDDRAQGRNAKKEPKKVPRFGREGAFDRAKDWGRKANDIHILKFWRIDSAQSDISPMRVANYTMTNSMELADRL